jgi:hypothetical protein
MSVNKNVTVPAGNSLALISKPSVNRSPVSGLPVSPLRANIRATESAEGGGARVGVLGIERVSAHIASRFH